MTTADEDEQDDEFQRCGGAGCEACDARWLPESLVEHLKERGVLVNANWLLEHPDHADPVFTVSLPGGES